MALTKEDVKKKAERDLKYFIRLVAPNRLLGSVHEELIDWWTRSERMSHQLVLLPRAHQKSQLLAYRVAWEITKNPALTFLYISATSGLAQKQLYLIKQILTSPIYRKFWPEMVNLREGDRERWTNNEISIDHPIRRKEGIRDSTILTGGLTTSLTGFHCDVACLDDVVVQENAYTEEGREKVRTQYSLLSSIENPDAEEWVVGTRYHPNDLYQDFLEMEEENIDEDGNILDSKKVFEVFERVVETHGEFLWPRQKREDGKWFGFNWSVLNKKKAQYLDKTQFYSQYYNSPNKGDGTGIDPELFQYYNKDFLHQDNGRWFYKQSRLNVVAAIDFAFSVSKRADYTALVVIGADPEGNIFVLDIYRFKTNKITDYYEAIAAAHNKWGFRKLRAEVVAAQDQIVNELKDQYLRPNGLLIAVEKYRPTASSGDKEERIHAVLATRYNLQMVWHYKGGNCQTLEEELSMSHPPHDDIKDALASAAEIAVAPSRRGSKTENKQGVGNVIHHPRFGGVAYK